MSGLDWRSTVYSDGTDEFVSPCAPAVGDPVTVTLRLHRRSPVTKGWVVHIPEGERVHVPLEEAGEDSFFRYLKGRIEMVQDELHYRFILATPDDLYNYSQAGLTLHTPGDHLDFRLRASFHDVPWLPGSVFYQIFPDRFRNGDPSLDVREGEYAYQGRGPRPRRWGESPLDFERGGHLDFFGGDLAGIEQSLDYLEELGVNALYLNPVFEAPSNHKYDVQDYYRIDPHLGTNDDFARLAAKAHARGFRMILDGVFNHLGMAHRWFNRCGFYAEQGAWGKPASPYRDFFTFYGGDEDYHCWLGVKSLPKLNFRSPGVRDAIYRADDSVVKFWMKPPYSIDGWRIDVANMTARQGAYQGHREVWRELRSHFKSVNPEAYLLGEHFFDPVELLQGDMLDGVMNYQAFLFPVLRFFTVPGEARIGRDTVSFRNPPGAEVLDRALQDVRARLGWHTARHMFNLLDCHDLPRAWSLLGRDEDAYRAAMTMLFAYPGVPSILYGDEIGMEGLTEAETRSCMEWDPSRWNGRLRSFFRRLIALRRSEAALREGGYMTLLARGPVFSFARQRRGEVIVVVASRDVAPASAGIPVWKAGLTSEGGEDLLTGERLAAKSGVLRLELPPKGHRLVKFERKDARRAMRASR